MTMIQEGRRTAEYIASEANGFRSRETGTVDATGGALEPGTVLGKITATDTLVALDPAAADGSQTAVGILYEGVAADQVVRRTYTARDTEVVADRLIYPTGITVPQTETADAQLAALGIIKR